MKAKVIAKIIEPPQHLYRPHPPPALPIEYVPVKVAHRKQFEEALDLIREEIAKGSKPRKILALLEERGLKTRAQMDRNNSEF